MHLLASIQLFPDGSLFLHVALILVMIWILNRTLYRPINNILESREKNKGGHSTEAEKILKDVDAKESRYTTELLDARSSGYEFIEKEQKAATAARDQQLAEAKAGFAATLESGKADLEKNTAASRVEIGTQVEKIADSIAATILKS